MAALLQGCSIPRSFYPFSSRRLHGKTQIQKHETWCCLCSVAAPLRLFPLAPYPAYSTSAQRNSRLANFRCKIAQPRAVGGGGGCPFAAVSEGASRGGSALVLFAAWYVNSLNKYPGPMKSLTSALLTLIGDLTCQLVIDRSAKWDSRRTFVFTFLGLVLVGPTLHFWYLYLSKLVTLQGPSGALLRLILDQFVFSPIFLAVFLTSLVTLEGRPSQVGPKLQQEWFSSVVANWKLWIPFQFLNFLFVPQQFQVLGANVVALVWNVILSFIAHKEVKSSSAE